MIIWRLPEIVSSEEFAKISKAQLARDIGIGRWNFIKLTLRQVERMDMFTLNKICRTLNRTPSDLFEYINDSDPDLVEKAVELLQRNLMSREEALAYVHELIEKDYQHEPPIKPE